jgi:hypothetical protein
LGAKKLVSQHAARGKHGVPIEDREQRKRDEEELRRRLWKSAPAEAYLPNVLVQPGDIAQEIQQQAHDGERRTAGGIILP